MSRSGILSSDALLFKIAAGFIFGNFAQSGRSKSTCIPNFVDISLFTAEILLILVSENKHPPCWNFTSGLNF